MSMCKDIWYLLTIAIPNEELQPNIMENRLTDAHPTSCYMYGARVMGECEG